MGKKKGKHKTYIGLPVYREVLPQTVVSLLSVSQRFDNIDFGVYAGCYIEHARNNLAELARRENADRILFVDGDVSFTLDDYVDMHRAMNESPDSGAICGMYSSHKDSEKLIVGFMHDDGSMLMEAECQKRGWEAIENKSLVPVDKAGAGFMMVDMKVFDKIDPPWFNTITEAGRFWGEDTYFLQLLKHNGYSPKINGGVVVTHTGPTPHKPEVGDHSAKLLELYDCAIETHKQQNEVSNEVSN
ncbi:MAG: hypothetical protein ACYSUD_13150 [Planctomycetota bacterium]|jgi:hypothetical protein